MVLVVRPLLGLHRAFRCKVSAYKAFHDRCKTMVELKDYLKEEIASQKEKCKSLDSAALARTLPRSQEELPVKSMRDSELEVAIPLGCDTRTHEKYLTSHNVIRFGRLLEDLDVFAVACTYAHCDVSTDMKAAAGAEATLNLRANVTASVERIGVHPDYRRVDNSKDINLRGSVTWVGKSSMAVSIHMSQDAGSGRQLSLMDAMFIIVSRHPVFGSACLVPRLVSRDERERRLLELGEAMHVSRCRASEESLLRKPPTEDERLIIHELFLSTLGSSSTSIKVRQLPSGAVWMEDTLLKNLTVCFPEHRNIYGKIFGGFLMRQAYELGWAAACLHAGESCLPLAVDDIRFEVPVDIGSFIFISAQVVHTKADRIQVKVHTEMVDVETRAHKTTNNFHFTFVAVNGKDVKAVFPKSYAESMMYLAGKRHFNRAVLETLPQTETKGVA